MLMHVKIADLVMKHLFLALFLTLTAISAEARCTGVDYREHLDASQKQRLQTEMSKVPFAYGNHWIATKGDRRIHVIGTMHVGDRRMGQIVRDLRPVLNKADAVLFEVSILEMAKTTEEENEAIIRKHFLLPKNRSLKKLASSETWKMLSRVAIARGMPFETLDRLQPWAASNALLGDSCGTFGFGTRRGMDERLARYAKRKGIPMGALETEDEAWFASSRDSLTDQMRSLELDLELHLSDAPINLSGEEAYFDQAVWEGFIMFRWEMYRHLKAPRREIDQHWRRFEQNLLVKRNKKWMGKIFATEAETLVVAVGAAHLPGRYGVLNLLKNKGYKMERGPW